MYIYMNTRYYRIKYFYVRSPTLKQGIELYNGKAKEASRDGTKCKNEEMPFWPIPACGGFWVINFSLPPVHKCESRESFSYIFLS